MHTKNVHTTDIYDFESIEFWEKKLVRFIRTTYFDQFHNMQQLIKDFVVLIPKWKSKS
jgi:hypothetical protein